MCCFELLNCYIYEASKKWRNRQMKREQVLALYDAYADSIYRVALGYLRSPHDAEDAVQAVCCKLVFAVVYRQLCQKCTLPTGVDA